MLRLRLATLEDLAELLPRTAALNAHEGIALDPAALERLLRDGSLSSAWLVERDGAAIGYAIATFGYDLEFGGRDATLTELWIDPPARGQGAGGEALALLAPELRARGVGALHLQVRPDKSGAAALPAQRLRRVVARGDDAPAVRLSLQGLKDLADFNDRVSAQHDARRKRSQPSEASQVGTGRQVQGRATRRAEGVNAPALPVQRGREGPLLIDAVGRGDHGPRGRGTRAP